MSIAPRIDHPDSKVDLRRSWTQSISRSVPVPVPFTNPSRILRSLLHHFFLLESVADPRI